MKTPELQNDNAPTLAALPAWSPIEALLYPAYRSWFIIAFFVGVGLLGGVFLAFTKPNTYRSKAKLLVRATLREEINAFNPDTISAETQNRAAIGNQWHIMMSESVFSEVVKEIGPKRILEPYDPRKQDTESTPWPIRKIHDFQAWWFQSKRAEALSKVDLDPSSKAFRAAVKTLRSNAEADSDGTEVLEVSYKATSPALAQEILRALISKYQDQYEKVYSIDYIVEEWRTTELEYAEKLEKAEEEFRTFQDEHDVFNLEVDLQNLVAEHKDLERNINSSTNKKKRAERRLKQLEANLKKIEPTMTIRGGVELVPNPDYLRVKRLLENQLEDLRNLRTGGYAEQSIEISSVKKTVTSLQNELDKLEPQLEDIREDEVRDNPEYLALADEINVKKLDIQELGDDITDKTRRRDKVDAEIKRLSGLALRYRELSSKVQSAIRQRESLSGGLEIADRLERLKELSSNVKEVEKPTLPFEKDGPKRMKLLIGGFAGGLMIGGVLALLRQYLDRTIRRRKDLELLLGVPVIEAVPKVSSWSWRAAQKQARKLTVKEVEHGSAR